jgi:hypothetical protein
MATKALTGKYEVKKTLKNLLKRTENYVRVKLSKKPIIKKMEISPRLTKTKFLSKFYKRNNKKLLKKKTFKSVFGGDYSLPGH